MTYLIFNGIMYQIYFLLILYIVILYFELKVVFLSSLKAKNNE